MEPPTKKKQFDERKRDWLVQKFGLRWLQRLDAVQEEPSFFLLDQEENKKKLRAQCDLLMKRETTTGVIIYFLQGLIVLGEDAVVISSNILASDGVLHALNKLLIPDDIQPLLPRYCNIKSFSRVSSYLSFFELINIWISSIWTIEGINARKITVVSEAT